MRKPVKFRLVYLCVAIATYLSGFLWLPQSMMHPQQPILSYFYLGVLLVALPVLFYLLVIVGGRQKLWRLIIPLSLGVVVAKYTLPAPLASHFEFISYLRYPIIAVILVIEFAVIFHVISSLWKARKLTGDPRLHALKDFTGDDKKQSVGVMAASEPASWYYAIPRLSKNHPPAVAKLMLLSRTRWHISLLLALLITLTVVSYYLIVPVSEIAAVIVTTVLCWSSVSLIASHRVSRHYSVYISHGQLMINASFFNMLCAPLAEISHVESGRWAKDDLGDAVAIGRGDTLNLKLTFHRSLNWLTMMAMVVEPVRDVYLSVEAPELAEVRIRKEIEKFTGATILQKAV